MEGVLTNYRIRIKEVWEHAGFQKYFRNTGWMFFGRIFSLAVSFFVGAYVIRYLGPEKYGQLSYVISFVGLFSFVASLGVDSILDRELVKYPEKRDELLGTGFFIKLFGSLSAIVLVSIISFFIDSDRLINLLVFLFSLIFIFQAFGVIEFFFKSQVLYEKIVKVQMVAMVVGSLLKLVAVFLHLGIFWFMIVYLMDSIIIAVGFLIIYNKKFTVFSWRFNNILFREILRDAWPMMFSAMAISIYVKIDQVMIRFMMNDEAVGLYSAAAKISELWYFVPGIICSSLFPAIVNAKRVNEDLYKRRLKRLYSLMIWLSIGIILPISYSSNFIIKAIFGDMYLGAVTALKIHIWASIGVFLSFVVAQYLITENYTKILFKISLIGAFSNIVINLYLIPVFGINGAAIATIISYSFTAISIIFFKQTRGHINLILKAFVFKI